MGRLSKKNIISGSVGNLVFRDLDGKQVVQSHPEEIRQTKATKASSAEFKQCSTWAKQLRIGLHSFLVGQTDSYMYRRLTGELYNALQSNTSLPKGERTPLNANMNNLAGFEFNINSPFKEYFLPEITATLDSQRQIHITIPELEPKSQMLFPERDYNAELLVYVYATKLEYNTPIADAFFTLPLQRNVALPHETVWTSPALPEGYFIVVTAKLMYYSLNKFTVKNYSNSKELNPAMVLFCGS